MHDNPNKPELVSSSTDQENSFTVILEEVNSVFGISADTLRTLAASYQISPEAMLVRAATMYAQADIPDFDLDAPELTPEQINFLEQRRSTPPRRQLPNNPHSQKRSSALSRVQEITMKMQNPALEMGDILRAWVPFDDSPKVAGPKFRPVIFLAETQIDGLAHWIVAYGTSQMGAHKESRNGAI